jgi:peptide chain release factor 1
MEFAPAIIAKLREKDERYRVVSGQMLEAATGDHKAYADLVREQGQLEKAHSLAVEMNSLIEKRTEAEALVGDSEADPELLELAQEELAELDAEELGLDRRIKTALVSDTEFERNKIIVEIRAGTGGDEATLFAADLFQMYQRLADDHKCKIEQISVKPTDVGGFKEIVFGVKGKAAYKLFRFESGGHRVQRVPVTESQGRIHTSAATVAVLPEPEDVDVDMKAEDLRIDTMRASGAGGQHVNKTESAVRIVHLPTNTMVVCMDEKSQHKNRAQAMRILRTRLFELERKRIHDKRAAARKEQVGTGDRSARIRTYNFPQNRCSDHRLGQNFSLEHIMAGRLGALLEALEEQDREERIKHL